MARTDKTISVKLPNWQLLALIAGSVLSKGDCNVEQAIADAEKILSSARRINFLDTPAKT